MPKQSLLTRFHKPFTILWPNSIIVTIRCTGFTTLCTTWPLEPRHWGSRVTTFPAGPCCANHWVAHLATNKTLTPSLPKSKRTFLRAVHSVAANCGNTGHNPAQHLVVRFIPPPDRPLSPSRPLFENQCPKKFAKLLPLLQKICSS